MKRPRLNTDLKATVFLDYYYLKEELAAFCRSQDIPASGNKEVLTKRITYFLKTGRVLDEVAKSANKVTAKAPELDDAIEKNFTCSEVHRAFYKKHIGKTFSFNVLFQKWLKQNTGKSYRESIAAYHQIIKEEKKNPPKIDKQFEYNAYICDFFKNNDNRSLKEAISCWNYKKSISGHNKYEASDLKFLD